jgi:ribonuclease BN (tRNA processing enzyme)
MALALTLLGTGSPAPLAHRGGSSYLVTLDGETLLFDCGPACVQRLLKKGVPPREITHLFLTHLHYDHCVDYGYLVLNRWDQGSGDIPELDVYGPPPIAEMTGKLFGEKGVYDPDLTARTRHEGSEFIYEMRGGVLPRKRPQPAVTEVAHGDTVSGGDWSVRVAEVVHVQPYLTCLAYRLDTPYQSIVFGGDTTPVKSLTELADGADVLIHMCHFINGFVTDPRITACCSGHLDAARTAREAHVRTLVLTHITEQLEGPGIRERVACEAGEIFDGHIIFGEDLLDVPLGDVEPSRIQ